MVVWTYWLVDCVCVCVVELIRRLIGVVECLNAPYTGIHAAEVRPRIPTPNCIWRELVWISSLAHVSKIHDLINLMSPPSPPPPSLKENRCWPPPTLRLISSKPAALQCPMVQVCQQCLGTSCNIMTHMDNPPHLHLWKTSGACSEEDSTNNPSSYLSIPPPLSPLDHAPL